MQFFRTKMPCINNTWTHPLTVICVSFLINACSISPDANKAGLFDSIVHLSKGTYQHSKAKKSERKNKLTQQLSQNKKRLYTLNQQLKQGYQESQILQKKLRQNRIIISIKNKELKKMKALYSSDKEKNNSLQQKIVQLDNNILLESDKRKKQSIYLISLEKKRDKLRKEILMQTSL